MSEIHKLENKLLMCTSRISLEGESCARLQHLTKCSLDWDYLLRLAQRHGLIPLLTHHLKSICPETIPEQPLSKLQNENREIAKSNLLVTAKLLKILRLLDGQGVRAIPYKGPVLAAAIYGDVGLRQFGDLDILVSKRDVLKVKELLMARGCRPDIRLTKAQEVALLKYYYEYPFRCDEQGVLVEVHWEIAERYFSFNLDFDELWERRQVLTIAGERVPILSQEDLLLVLCAHNSKHFWQRLGWICDVASLVNSEKPVDWQRLLETATRQGMRRVLLLGLSLATNLLAAQLPAEVCEVVHAESAVRSLTQAVQNQLFRECDPQRPILRSALIHLQMRERVRDKLRYCLGLTMTTTVNDWLLLPLPRWLLFLYYPLRLARLAYKYGARMIKTLYGRLQTLDVNTASNLSVKE